MDLFGDQASKDAVNPFVQLLWDNGNTFEQEVIGRLNMPFTDLKASSREEKERLTIEAMEGGDELIYGGRIRIDDIIGEPDIIRRCSSGYLAGDIKSGAGEEGGGEDTDGKPKKHYAVQLALYTDILERIGFSGGRKPFVWDVHGREVIYDLNAKQGVRKQDSLWDEYLDVLETVRAIVAQKKTTHPAYGNICKLCHWYTACKKSLEEHDDLTLIPELGRSKRDIMIPHLKCREDLANADLRSFIQSKKTIFPGIGSDMLIKFKERAMLQKKSGSRPYIKTAVDLPRVDRELFFDVETDPMRDICYLHGFVERFHGDNRTERYIAFVAEYPTADLEKRAFKEAWAYVKGSMPCMIYYYSAYERTIWRKLQKKYPHVMTGEELEKTFEPERAIDLYHHIIRPKTEWPTYDLSIKTLASYLGFSWRDSNPSGAASIEWYHRWVDVRDPSIRQRILDYNEDDCKAMRILLDGIRRMVQA
jgi:predicted RecB family nuclease